MKTKTLFSALTVSLTLIMASCGDKAPFQRTGLLEGAPNFRDLGNYPTTDGGVTVPRKIYRSEKLSALTDGDIETFRSMGIKTVIDFRGVEEALAEPSRLPDGVTVVNIPIEVGNTGSFAEQMASGQIDSLGCVGLMQDVNRAFVGDFSPQYRDFFNVLLKAENHPVVFHCTAGKDRTGFASAMLLTALGVDWDTVMADYMLTNEHLKPSAMPPAMRPLWGVHTSYLAAAHDEIGRRFDTMDDYLSQELGLNTAEKTNLRNLLVR